MLSGDGHLRVGPNNRPWGTRFSCKFDPSQNGSGMGGRGRNDVRAKLRGFLRRLSPAPAPTQKVRSHFDADLHALGFALISAITVCDHDLDIEVICLEARRHRMAGYRTPVPGSAGPALFGADSPLANLPTTLVTAGFPTPACPSGDGADGKPGCC